MLDLLESLRCRGYFPTMANLCGVTVARASGNGVTLNQTASNSEIENIAEDRQFQIDAAIACFQPCELPPPFSVTGEIPAACAPVPIFVTVANRDSGRRQVPEIGAHGFQAGFLVCD